MRPAKSPTDLSLTVVVPDDLRDFFLEDAIVNKPGGFQSLARIIRDRLQHSKVLHLDPSELERLARYADNYGEGGLQTKFRRIVIEWVKQNASQL